MILPILLTLLLPGLDEVHTRGRAFRVHTETDAASTEKVILLARQPGEAWVEVGEGAVGGTIRFVPPGDGTFHLSAVAVGIDGSREKPGSEPEVVLVVDTVPPELIVSRSLEGMGPSVRILWEARDANLPSHAVTVRLELADTDATWKGGAEGKVVLSPPSNGESWTVRLLATDRAGNQTEAVISYPEIDPSTGLAEAERRALRAYGRGRSMLSMGRWAEAERHLRKAVRLSPRDARAWNDLGVSLYHRGKKEEASEAFDRAVDVSPDDPILRWNFALTGGDVRDSQRGTWKKERIEFQLAALTSEQH
ncbi:MAG: tetratricopeptide repeat protein [Planctomycetota bacterium]|nr:tetratricopeptide repeat protein [Planctomycetota bacterium]